jgi:hypothetical protein
MLAEAHMQSEFTTVGTYSTSIEAHAVKNFLDANGIRHSLLTSIHRT